MDLPLIIPIIEGQSEETSIPLLIRRVLQDQGIHDLAVRRGFRARRNKLVKPGELERTIGVARLQPETRAIALIIDADDDCPALLGPQLLGRGTGAVGSCHLSVVLAKCEIEAWIIASIDSVRGICGINHEAVVPDNPESIRDAKGWLTRNMIPPRTYVPVDDLPTLVSSFDYGQAAIRSRSLQKFLKSLDEICAVLRGH